MDQTAQIPTMADRIAAGEIVSVGLLRAASEAMHLPLKDRNFASSLAASLAKFGTLTDRQMPYAKSLIIASVSPQMAPTRLDGFAGMVSMFTKAQSEIKRPTLRISSDLGTLYLSVAKAHHKEPGTINVRDARKTWFGRILLDGRWEPCRSVPADSDRSRSIVAALTGFAAEPAMTARAYGFATSTCCCCGRALTTYESIRLGIGPVCAKRFGLEAS